VITVPSSSAPTTSSGTVTDAGGLPVLSASTGQQANQCVVIGSATDSSIDATVQGVVCADIITATTSGGYTAQGQIQAYCQTPAAVDVQCADVIAEGELANEENGVVETTGSYQCGHSYGSCSTGRNYIKTGIFSYSGFTDSDCSSSTNLITDLWSLAVGNDTTQIELPGSDKWVDLSAANENDNPSQSTGHYYICP
jgi:hypothetical protein